MKTITFPFSSLTGTIQPSKPVILTYNANGGSGSIPNVVVNIGTPIELSDGTGLTPPEGKVFDGWAKKSTDTEPNVESPYSFSADTTLYAVWVDEPTPESDPDLSSET